MYVYVYIYIYIHTHILSWKTQPLSVSLRASQHAGMATPTAPAIRSAT